MPSLPAREATSARTNGNTTSITVGTSSIGSITYLAPSGSLGEMNTQAALAGAVSACVETSRSEVVLDLDRVPLVNGRGLEVILDANDRLTAAGGSFKFVNASPLVSDILIASGIASSDPSSDFGANTVSSAGQRLAPQLKKIGEILIEMGLIDDAQRAEALQLQARSGKQLGAILIEKRTISEADLYKALSRQSGIPYIALRPGLYDPAAAAMVPGETARRLNVLPMFKVRDTLTLATADPQAIPALDEIQSIAGGKLCLVLSRREEITKCHYDAYSALLFVAAPSAEELQRNLAGELADDDFRPLRFRTAGSWPPVAPGAKRRRTHRSASGTSPRRG